MRFYPTMLVATAITAVAAYALAEPPVTSLSVKFDYRETPATAYYAAFCERDTLKRIAEAPGGPSQIPNYTLIDHAAKEYEEAVRQFIGTELDAPLQTKIKEKAVAFQADYLRHLQSVTNGEGTADAQGIFNHCVELAEKHGAPLDAEWLGMDKSTSTSAPTESAPAAPVYDESTQLRLDNLRDLIANYEGRMDMAKSELMKETYRKKIRELEATIKEIEAGQP